MAIRCSHYPLQGRSLKQLVVFYLKQNDVEKARSAAELFRRVPAGHSRWFDNRFERQEDNHLVFFKDCMLHFYLSINPAEANAAFATADEFINHLISVSEAFRVDQPKQLIFDCLVDVIRKYPRWSGEMRASVLTHDFIEQEIRKRYRHKSAKTLYIDLRL